MACMMNFLNCRRGSCPGIRWLASSKEIEYPLTVYLHHMRCEGGGHVFDPSVHRFKHDTLHTAQGAGRQRVLSTFTLAHSILEPKPPFWLQCPPSMLP